MDTECMVKGKVLFFMAKCCVMVLKNHCLTVGGLYHQLLLDLVLLTHMILD